MLPWGNDFHFITTTPGNYQYLYIHSLKEQYIHTNICTSRYVSKHTHTHTHLYWHVCIISYKLLNYKCSCVTALIALKVHLLKKKKNILIFKPHFFIHISAFIVLICCTSASSSSRCLQ